MRRLVDRIGRWFWPAECSLCPRPSGVNPYFCADCWAHMVRLAEPWCSRCGLPFPSAVARAQSPGHQCANCRARSPDFDLARAAVAYEGVAAAALRLFKYQRRRALARPLAELIDPLPGELGRVDAVLPVPLHVERLREREFNQALALAQALSRRTGWPVWWDLLERTRATPAQVGLDAVERRRNVKGAFAARDPARLEGKRVVLVDDVLTTGSTLNECARTLKRAGAVSVAVLTIA
ncbi:MAG: ComF family protein, partial [Nitrospirota bacterium]